MCYNVDMIEKPNYKKAKGEVKALGKECIDLWQQIVKTRAGYKCEYQGCYQTGRLNAHHVFAKGAHGSTKYDPDNGLCLCYNHHKGGKEGAHCDINFKEKILGRYPGYKAIRSEQWFTLLERKAWTPTKVDLKLEKLYLKKTLQDLQNQCYSPYSRGGSQTTARICGGG